MNKIHLKKKEIDKGLKFYNIDDNLYKENCYKCLNNVLENAYLKKKCSCLYKKLYNNLSSSLRASFKTKKIEELFCNNYPIFLTNLLLLLGYKVHKKNIKKHKLSNFQTKIHKQRVKEALTKDIYTRKLKEIRISQMLWGIYFINIKIIEIGRLQFEHYKEKNENYIKIHIPADKKLIYSDVVDSLRYSKKEIKKYFKSENISYYCYSWLLSKQITTLVDSESNIYKFQTLFEIVEGDNCIKDILNFVYQKKECPDFSTLEENTSLQKKVKSYLLKGNNIYLGIGKLKDNI